MVEKIYLTAQEFLEDSFKLGAMVLKSGFRPSFIIAIWRGGTPIAIAVQEVLSYFGVKSNHIAIRTSSYTGIDERSSTVRVHGMDYVVKNVKQHDALLIVDDVFDTGLTVDAVINHLREKARSTLPSDIRVAVPWYKPTRGRTDRVPDYYLHTTDKWLKFPYSLEGLTEEEVRTNRADIYKIIEPLIHPSKSADS
ncbi:MAG: hypoxanthine phosphoribosyltransferase [Proteobacteria bacterium]|nr:hypoxanthine phosphoribosyltransferase [Pseudomonadota bacterium]